MKKILTSMATIATITSALHADIARVEMGAGAWAQTPSGTISANNTGLVGKDTSTEQKKNLGYAWVLIKHPIPILPNLRLEYTNVESAGKATGTFTNFTANGSATSLKMKQYDIIPYYNILDNTFWMTLDIGIDIKVIDSTYSATNVVVNKIANQNYTDTATIAIPLVYLRSRVEIPITNIGLEADVKYVSYSANTLYDARVKVDYTLDFIPVIQPAIEVGYRVQHIETDQTQKEQLNLDFKGVYAGLMLRF